MTASRTALVVMLGIVLAACATPAPKAVDFQRSVPPDYLGLLVDTDLLDTSKLDQQDRNAAQELLKTYYSAEYSLSAYIEALEANLGRSEQLTKDYATADAFVGAAAGLSSIGVIFATAAVAAPITGVVWIGVSQFIQHYNIEPQVRKTDRQLTEALSLLRLFPDIEKIFDGLAYAETREEAGRRFKKWAAYVKNLEARTAKFFAKIDDGRQIERDNPGVPPPAAPVPSPPSDKNSQ